MKRLISEEWEFKLKSGAEFTDFYISLEGNRHIWSRGDSFEQSLTTFKKEWKILDFQVIEYDAENNVWRDHFTKDIVSKAIQ